MKLNVLFLLIFISFLFFAFYSGGQNSVARINCTELNGTGCVCHSLEEDLNVKVWIEGPDTVIAGQRTFYKMYMAGGPAQAGGYNVATRFGILDTVGDFSVWDFREPNELTQAYSLPIPNVQDTVFWPFIYIPPYSFSEDTLYSCGLSLVWDSIPDFRDRWAYGPKHRVIILPDPTPVEFISLSCTIIESGVLIQWQTASENNNKGFDIERSPDGLDWNKIGYVEGSGTSTELKNYKFVDETGYAAFYRIRQIDLDGNYSFSSVIENKEFMVHDFKLEQNYPNPFNPSTAIRFQIPSEGRVTLQIFSSSGERLNNFDLGLMNSGSHEFNFNATNLASGVYLYAVKIITSSEKNYFQAFNKMLLLK